MVPLGVTSTQTVLVKVLGYGDSVPHITVVLPIFPAAAPLTVTYPATTTPHILPLVLTLSSEIPVVFATVKEVGL